MPMVFVEDFSEWCDRQGGEGLDDGGRIYFPSGAMCDDRGVMRWEPPSDKYKLLRAQRYFWQLRVDRAERAFNRTKQEMANRAHWASRNAGPGLNPGDAAALKELQQLVKRCRRELAKIDTKLRATPEEQDRRVIEEMERERQQAQQAFLAEVSAIEI